MTEYLYHDKANFDDFVVRAAKFFKTTIDIVEKDYFVSLILKELSDRNKNIVFKGGTSLSKAYQIIDRFSEDIDLSLCNDDRAKPVSGQKVKLKRDIENTIKLYGFSIPNLSSTGSRKNYNVYEISYDSVGIECDINEDVGLRPHILLETYCHHASFPTTEKSVENYINRYLLEAEIVQREVILIDYPELVPFTMKVQSLERTVSDKLFAICDKWLDEKEGAAIRQSRHIYDLYFLLQSDELDYNCLKDTFIDVRMILKQDLTHNPSSAEKHNIPILVNSLLEANFFEEDYEKTTKLLTDQPPDYVMVKNYLLHEIGRKAHVFT